MASNMSMRTQAPAAGRFARRAAINRAAPVRRTRSVVVEAIKKSVGDLTKKDLEGKAVFVR